MPSVRIERHEAGETSDGVPVARHDLIAPDGATVSVLDLAAVLQRVTVPDRHGVLANVVLSHATVAEQEVGDAYLGSVVGRVAGRIGGARATVAGREHRFAANDGPNHLHGGPTGFHRRVWTSQASSRDDDAAEVTLTYRSPDGEEGYPGTLEVEVRYLWTVDHRLRVTFRATTDAETLVNLTQHAHWNLAGEGAGTVDDHRLRIAADAYLPIDAALLPTGAFASVEGTPFDLRTGGRLGDVVRSNDPQIRRANGIDHSFVLGSPGADGMRPAARLTEPASGRRLTVSTDQPGIQVYSGNVFSGTIVGSSGRAYRQGDGIALETQLFPDAPNHPAFPSVVLAADAVYRSETWFAFDIDPEAGAAIADAT